MNHTINDLVSAVEEHIATNPQDAAKTYTVYSGMYGAVTKDQTIPQCLDLIRRSGSYGHSDLRVAIPVMTLDRESHDRDDLGRMQSGFTAPFSLLDTIIYDLGIWVPGYVTTVFEDITLFRVIGAQRYASHNCYHGMTTAERRKFAGLR